MRKRTKLWALGAVLALPMSYFGVAANANVPTTLFQDGFEGSASFATDTNWVTPGSGYFFPGSGSGSTALGFAMRTSGGDAESVMFPAVPAHTYTLDTQYATDGDPGFIGVNEYDASHALIGQQWVLGGDPAGSPLGALSTATGTWNSYSQDFVTDPGTAFLTVIAEDWDQGCCTGPATTQVFFDNVSVSTFYSAPTANDDTFLTPVNTNIAGNVLTNDSDSNVLPLTASLSSGPSHGTLQGGLGSDGSFTYKPDHNFKGLDQFTYDVSNGYKMSSATAYITVDNVPVANNDSYRTGRDTPLTTSTVGAGVLGNDTDANGDVLTATLVSPTMAGSSLTLNPNGTFTYTPPAGFRGIDSFTYTASDGLATSNVATAWITVNTPPVAATDTYGGALEETTFNVTAGSGVLANDTDADGDPLTAVLVNNPSHGSLTLNPDGSFSYKAANNYIGPDSFSYKAYDGIDYSAPAAVNLTVSYNGVPDPTSININGPGSVKKGQSFTSKAMLSSPDPACLGGRTVTFDYEPGGTIRTTTSTSNGSASVTISGTVTSGWTPGNFTLTVSTPASAEPGGGGGQCAAGSSTQKFKVTGK